MDKPCKKILVVEDNIVNQKIIVAMLNKLGHPVDVVFDGKQAVDATRECNYQLILMDCQMPVMDGYEAAAQIRRQETSSRRPVIVALSANALADHDQRCASVGIDDMLAKPIDLELLRTKVNFWLEKSEHGNVAE